MQRIVFVNLHANEMFLKTMPKYVFRQSCAIKHKYLLNYLLNNTDKFEVCTYLNDRAFSLMHNGNKALLDFLNKFKFIENKIVLKKNGIDNSKITVISNISDIKKDDIVIVYRHHSEQLRNLSQIKSFKAVSMIHFWGDETESQRIQNAEIDCMFNECNLQKTSEIFRKYYDFTGDWIVHPFVFAERFQNKKPFNERKNMAFATGTITYKNHKEFLDTYGDPCDQPSRKQIKDNPEFFKDTVYCTSSDYLEDSNLKTITSKDNFVIGFFKSLYNRFNTGQQKKYFSFDMVESFNNYKMCIVGEEILGVPGIGFVEGMACGCAYIGLNSSMYTDLGLVPNVHYITYDGTKEDLKKVIEYYQMDEHQAELEKIAKTGCEYVRANFNGDAVAERLLSDLAEKQREWLSK